MSSPAYRIGWDGVGDISPFKATTSNFEATTDADKRFNELLLKAYPDMVPSVVGRSRTQLLNFLNKMAIGDYVLAADGSVVIAVGRITGEYRFDPSQPFHHHRPVQWLSFEEWQMPDFEGLQTTLHEMKKAANILQAERAAQSGSVPLPDKRPLAEGELEENLLRKQYTLSELCAIVDHLRGFTHGGFRLTDQSRNCDVGPLTTAATCRRVGLTKDDYYRMRCVMEKGVPEVVSAMDAETLSISAAAVLAGHSTEDQLAVMAKPNNEARWTAKRVVKQLRRVRNAAEKADAEAKPLIEYDSQESIRLFHCRFQALEEVADLSPDSVRMICTDIPYDGHFVDQLDDLAAMAERVLAPGGVFVSYLGQHRLDEKIAALSKRLTYRWLPTSAWSGTATPVQNLNLKSQSIPLVVYSKGDWSPPTYWHDTFIDSGREKSWHPWQRSLGEIEKLIEYFSEPDDLIVDPCGGGFTTAIACHRLRRRCVSVDVEKACVVRGQQRLREDQILYRPNLSGDANAIYIGI